MPPPTTSPASPKSCPGCAATASHEWIARVEADHLPDLHSFTAGLKRDLAAVVNGLTLPYSSGAVEGTVNRIKMLKRQMYGRASFDLLRKRVLLTA
jgi:transposase